MDNNLYEMIFKRKSFHLFRNIGNEKITKKVIIMNDYFEKYIEAKKCLCGMLLQFFSTILTFDEMKKLEIPICKDDIFLDKYIEICSHNFQSDGLLAWHYLNIKKEFMTFNEMLDFELDIKNEKFDSNINYYEEYLKISILLIDMTTKYYSRKIDIQNAIDNNIKFDDAFDEIGNKIQVCYHICESAGENVWNLLSIDDAIVGCSIFNNIRDKYKEELLKHRNVLTKKLY